MRDTFRKKKESFKKKTIIFQIPWLLVYFATNVYYLYASRALNGFFSGGVYIVVPIFLVEVASDE